MITNHQNYFPPIFKVLSEKKILFADHANLTQFQKFDSFNKYTRYYIYYIINLNK